MSRVTQHGRWIALLVAMLVMVGCASNTKKASVTEAWHQPLRAPIIYTVQKGDSLYSIAFGYGVDYRQIARVNHLKPPYHIHTGQQLRLIPINMSRNITTPTVVKTAKTAPRYVERKSPRAVPVSVHTPAPIENNQVWMWPAHGTVNNNFSSDKFNKGIDINGRAGSPIVAAAAGRIVYAGNGLHGYGNLIIIKHNADFLSAYAHNQKLLVHEGQLVRRGQMIATMGNTEAKHVMLHFEIRQAGKPVDPTKFLPLQ